MRSVCLYLLATLLILSLGRFESAEASDYLIQPSKRSFFEPNGWTESGGEVLRYAKNPWFVKNTPVVHYCLQIDTKTFSTSEETAREVFREALTYWKTELTSADGVAKKPQQGFAQLGTQDFIEDSQCGPQSQLRIVLGEGGLTQQEKDYLVEPRNFLGVSVRTEYDFTELRGRGFIYISSDLGPRAYDTLPNTDHLIPKAWQNRKLLLYAYLHELGHLFGIAHTGTTLMSEVFLDQLLHKRFSKFYLENPVESFLSPPLNFEICNLNGSFNATFLQIPLDTRCLRLEGKAHGSIIEWKLFSKKSASSASVPAGTIRASKLPEAQMSAKPITVIHLPPDQKVFTLADRFINTFMLGPVFNEGGAQGIFKTAAGDRPHDVQVQLESDGIAMTGLVSGRMMPVLVYSPPSLLKQLYPIEM